MNLTMLTTVRDVAAPLLGLMERRASNAAFIQLIEDFILGLELLDISERLSIVERLAASPRFRKAILEAKNQEELAQVLKRYGVLPNAPLSADAHIALNLLMRMRFRDSAGSNLQVAMEAIADGNRLLVEGLGDQRRSDEALMDMLKEIHSMLLGESANKYGEGSVSVDMSAGNTVVLDAVLGIPLITPWSLRLEDMLNPQRSLSTGKRPLEVLIQSINQAKSKERRNDLSILLSDIALLAADNSPEEALMLATRALRRQRDLDAAQRALLLRLLGGLHLDVGDNGAAIRFYKRARDAVESLPTKTAKDHNAKSWLQRQIKFDWLNLSEVGFDGLDKFAQRQRDMLNTPAWHENPAVDSAIRAFTKGFSDEVQAIHSASDTRWRIGSNLEVAIVHYRRALVLAYLGGNHFSAGRIRSLFAQVAWPARSQLSESGIRFVVEEMIAATNSTELRRFLGVFDHEVARLIDWDELALRSRTTGPIVGNTRERDRTTLTIVRQMADYIGDDVRKRLNSEFVNRTVHHLSGKHDSLIGGGGGGETPFLEAYKRIFEPPPSDLRRLVESLIGYDPNAPFSPWELLAWHNWQEADHESAKLVVHTLTSADSTTREVSDKTLLTLIRIARRFDDLDSEIEEWFLTQASVPNRRGLLRFLLDKRRPNAEAQISEWTRKLVDDLVAELEKAKPGKLQSFPIGRIAPAFFVAVALQHYGHAFSAEERYSIVERLFRASSNPAVFSQMKADVFTALAEIVSGMDADYRARVRKLAMARNPSSEQAATLDFPIAQHASDSDEARICLIYLRSLIGIDIGVSELSLLSGVLSTYTNVRALDVALRTVEVFVRDSVGLELLYGLVYNNLFLPGTKLEALASTAQFFIRTSQRVPEALGTHVQTRLEKLVVDGHGSVAHAILLAGVQTWADQDETWTKWLVEIATKAEASVSRSVRVTARRLLDLSRE